MKQLKEQDMKQYTCTKTVKARPCNISEAIAITGRSIKPANEYETEGYLVQYEDGYLSWSPKSTFESGYHCSETPLDRLKLELLQLTERNSKLKDFFKEGFDTVSNKIGGMQASMLVVQQNLMNMYQEILEQRIEDLEH